MLAVNNLDVVYEDVILVLKNVTLEVPAGAIVALLGANGAGKTTLLRAVTGLLDVHRGAVTRGSVTLDGQPLHHLDAPRTVAAGIGQVMEGRRIFTDLTVDENLRIGGHAADRATVAAGLDRAYSLFPVLADRRQQPAGYLSGGEQQMLAIGRALMSQPAYLLLDEPSLGLAPRLVQHIKELIVEINRQGTAILLVEQNASMALSIASHGYVLETGKVVMDGAAAELLANDDIREFYLGLSEERDLSFRDVKHYRRRKRWLS
ncbi:ABC transporter ATP-binding protein [Phytoactinopolyspora halotolerans]|uniref:ABC transporter ATP-binding protein n=1 Tax=Phytoactinopolyspora halotolerans TaxID=1981512 RepID=A0A6L9SAS3_9ACTN|nr:ABC transporter ATP-binding protein [Phytoactinopolyspora halotolerans]